MTSLLPTMGLNDTRFCHDGNYMITQKTMILGNVKFIFVDISLDFFANYPAKTIP